MRLFRAVEDAFAAAAAAFNIRQIIRWTRIGLIVTATATVVMLASFVAVALNLS